MKIQSPLIFFHKTAITPSHPPIDNATGVVYTHCCQLNQDLQGGVKVPTGGYSPRAARHDLV